MPKRPFRMPEEYVQHVGRVFSATQKSLFRIPIRHIRTFRTMVTAAEKPLPHAPAPASAPYRFLFRDFQLSKFFTTEMHKYACRDLTERQRKDKHPYNISRHHPSIFHIFITPPQLHQPVETQNLASHEKVRPNHTCNNQTVITMFLARDTPTGAIHMPDNQSPAGAFHVCETPPIANYIPYNQSPASAFPTRETHPIANYTPYNQSLVSALLACETQDFASLLFGRQRGKRNHIYCWKKLTCGRKNRVHDDGGRHTAMLPTLRGGGSQAQHRAADSKTKRSRASRRALPQPN